MILKDELIALFGANVPMINLITYEEERVIRCIRDIPGDLGIYSWDIADGFATIKQGRESLPAKECTTDTLLPYIEQKAPRGTVFILKDFHHSWNQKKPFITRKLRNMTPALRQKSQFLIFITPEMNLPMELKDDVTILHVPLADAGELDQLFKEVTGKISSMKRPKRNVQEKLVSSALGLTTNQARTAFSRVWARYNTFDERGIGMITASKREVVRESGALEFSPAMESIADVGGLDLMKAWLTRRELAFTSEAKQVGLKFPRGVALIGIPGTGKSLTAKVTSGLWKMPLLRLDVGALFGSLLGESEQNMRKAIMLAETVSPCILWIDEMEKAFAGVSASSANSGAATRVFGSFLTWMQEHETPVFVISTANDVSALPVELLGRFDRTFFLDLPNDVEREAIFLIYLKKAGEIDPKRKFRKLSEFVSKTRGFVGREIERIVYEAQFTAFADGNREIEDEDIFQAIKEVVPINKSHSEVIDTLRKWKTEGRAFPASSEEKTDQVKGGRAFDI